MPSPSLSSAAGKKERIKRQIYRTRALAHAEVAVYIHASLRSWDSRQLDDGGGQRPRIWRRHNRYLLSEVSGCGCTSCQRYADR